MVLDCLADLSGNMVIYFKNSEEIADILASMGAYKVLMDFHNAKIVKEIRRTGENFSFTM